MSNKSLLAVLVAFLVCTITVKGQQASKNAVDVILSSYSAKMFTTVPVTDNQIDQIIKCGIKAPSARNGQPWKFTVVKDATLLKNLMPSITSGNILIFISAMANSQSGFSPDFDCALAMENMYVAAQSIGLGAHIYVGPVNDINTNKKQLLSLPEGYKVIAFLRVGNVDKNIDATSSATTRKKPEEVVNYK